MEGREGVRKGEGGREKFQGGREVEADRIGGKGGR